MTQENTLKERPRQYVTILFGAFPRPIQTPRVKGDVATGHQAAEETLSVAT